MTKKGGKNFLISCLVNMPAAVDIDELLCYKYGNRKHTEDYQHDIIASKLTEAETTKLKSGVPFVVACYIHMEIYVAWHQSVGLGNGKFAIEKRELVAFENNPACDYKEILTGKTSNDKVYIFRNETGIAKFFEVALPFLNRA